jgi:hypothetical protein
VAIQSGCGLVFVRRLRVCAAVEQEPDHGGASGVGGGVQRGGAVVAADVDGEAEVQHERNGRLVPRLGGVHQRSQFGLVQVGGGGRQVEGRRPVAGHARADEPGGVGQTVPAQEPGEVGPAPDRG